MSKVQAGLKYSAEHEWIDDADPATVGVTQVATDALGDVVYVDLPGVGDTVTAGEVCGEIESTKSVSELYAPVSGEVVEVNQNAIDQPEIVNSSPYGDGWLFRVKVSARGPLLTPEEYAAENDTEVE